MESSRDMNRQVQVSSTQETFTVTLSKIVIRHERNGVEKL